MAYATRTFRVFVSSTFADLKAERDALQQRVFPQLRRFCQQRGARFQAIDLRWGVSEEAGRDQRTMAICLDEIRRSQRVSPRLNFLMLLGDRYGWRPLPDQIIQSEFDELLQHMPDGAQAHVRKWYWLDENALPPAMVLQPRTGPYSEYETWTTEEDQLSDILRSALDLVPANTIGPDQRAKYEVSATEREIVAGALSVPDAHEHVFGFFRTINGWDRLPDDPQAWAYVDLVQVDGERQLDREAHERLTSLKQRLREYLSGNIVEYEARWTGGDISTSHINTLCADVYERLRRVIEAELAAREQVAPLEQEVAAQWAFAADRSPGPAGFVGRADILDTIARYLNAGALVPSSSSKSNASPSKGILPLLILGDSGSGKSALIARAAEQAKARVPHAEVLVRFVAATPGASDTRSLLDGLCRQISRAYNADESTLPTDEHGLALEFPSRLALATAEKPLIVFLDALDQLESLVSLRGPTVGGWVPVELPEHVRIIATSRPGVAGLAYLEARLPAEHMARLECMTREEGDQLLTYWLGEAGRTLQPQQYAEVLDKFAPTDQASGLPLYLKLAFEEARRWASYTPSERSVLAPDIPGIIRQLFARLSDNADHGPLLVARSLGYLGAAKRGLSEDEILDVLSADVDVMSDFAERAKHDTGGGGLPVVVWSRLYYDLEPYLTERRVEGGIVYTFYHSQLADTTRSVYLSGEEGDRPFRALARYFAGLPLRIPLDDEAHSAGQGAVQVSQEGSGVANLRKLDELPYHQTMSGLWDELMATLTDFTFLEEKVTQLGVVERMASDGSVSKTYTGIYLLQDDFALAQMLMPWS